MSDSIVVVTNPQTQVVTVAGGTTVLTEPAIQVVSVGIVGPPGSAGAAGSPGAAGPNLINSSTATTLSGFLYGNGSIVLAKNNVALTDAANTYTGLQTMSGRLVLSGGDGTSTNPDLSFANSSAVNPIVRWNPTAGQTGLMFYSGTTQIARLQDNGGCYFKSMSTLGGMSVNDFFICRGTPNQGSQITFNSVGAPALYCQNLGGLATTTTLQADSGNVASCAAIFKACAGQTQDLIQMQDSVGAVWARFLSNRVFRVQSASQPNGFYGKVEMAADTGAINAFVFYVQNGSNYLYTDGLGLMSTAVVQWRSGTNFEAIDTKLVRQGAGTLQITDGSNASGSLTLANLNADNVFTAGITVSDAATVSGNLFAPNVGDVDGSASLSFGGTVITALASGGFAPPSTDDASAQNGTVYYSTTANKLVYKDSGGVTNPLY